MNMCKVTALLVLANLVCDAAIASEQSDRALGCELSLRKSIEAKVIRDISVEDEGIKVLVDKHTWSAMDFADQTALVKTVVCMITAGDVSKTARVNVVEPTDMTVLGKFDGLRLAIP